MNDAALIVEDDSGVAALLSEQCAAMGVAVLRARGGTEAAEHLAKGAPKLAIIDVTLADSDGFQVAAAVRATAGGEKVPILLVSGVFKRLPEGVAEKVRAAFLPKPFDPATLRETLGRMLGVGTEGGGLRGRFDQRAPASLVAELCEKRSTGALDVSSRDVKRRVFFSGGLVRFAQSNVKSEAAGAKLVADGVLSAEAFARAVDHARSAKVTMADALVAVAGATPEQGQLALKQQAEAVLLGVLGMAGADWSFASADVEKLPDARLHPLLVFVEHARRTVSPADAREALEARGDAKVTRSALFDRELFTLRQGVPGETVTAHAGKVGLSEQLKRTRDDDLPMLWSLVQCGLLVLSEPNVDRRTEGAGGPVQTSGVMIGGGRAPQKPAAANPAAPDPDKGIKFTPQAVAAREAIKAEVARQADATHYEVLGISPKATPEAIKNAFLEAARKWHTDAFSGLELGSARAQLAALFARVNEANTVLGDEQKRAEYDIYVDRKKKGLPTDVATIIEAEKTFQKGERYANANKWADALPLFREAVAANPGEPEFFVYLGYATFKVEGPGAAEMARETIRKGLAESAKLPSGHLFLGLIAKDTGNEAEALEQFKAALEIDPKHSQSIRALRDLRRDIERRKGGGGFLAGIRKIFGG